MNRSFAALALFGLVLGALPATARAQFAVNIGSFGHHAGGIGANYTTQPIGIDECDDPMTLTFTGISTTGQFYIDVWTASASATCGEAASRNMTTGTCRYVDLDESITMYPGGTMFAMTVTPAQLFGGCESGSHTFFFFQVTSPEDRSAMLTLGTTVAMTLDALAPTPAPTITGDLAGDATVSVSWTNPTDTLGGAQVYFDPDGCGGGDGGASSTLVAGAPPPDTTPVFTNFGNAPIRSTSIASSALWPGASGYGQTGAIAVTVFDTARNESVLSNVVCVEHVSVTGFWNQYCAERGLTVDECTARYGGCSVGLPTRRLDLGMISVMAAGLGVLFARRRAR